MNYILLESGDAETLEKLVNGRLEQGYQLAGGVNVRETRLRYEDSRVCSDDRETTYTQAMILK